MRSIYAAASFVCAMFAAAESNVPLSEFVRSQVKDSFPAPVAQLQCDPGNAPAFQCRGLLADGRLIEVEAKRGLNGAISITDLVYHVTAAATMLRHLKAIVWPAIATLDCPPEAIDPGEFDCRGTLADGSRIAVHGRRRRDFALEVGPITYAADAPAPLVTAARAAVEPLESVTCPAEALTTSLVCTGHTIRGTIAAVRITKKPDGTLAGESEYANDRFLRLVFKLAVAAAIVGPLLLIGGVIQLVRLNLTNFVARVPITSDQTINFSEPGPYVMMAEGPQFTMAWRELQFSLRNAVSGADVPLYRDILNLRVAGVSRVRRSYRRFTVENPGQHILHLTSQPPDRDLSSLSAFFGRSFLGRGIVCIALSVSGAALTVIGLIAALSA